MLNPPTFEPGARAHAPGSDDASAVLFDLWIEQLAAIPLQGLERAFLIRSHEARISRHIGGEDRRKTTFDRLLHGFPKPTTANGQSVRTTIMISCSPRRKRGFHMFGSDAYRQSSTR